MSNKCKKLSLGIISKNIILVFLAAIIHFCLFIIKQESKFFAVKNYHPIVYLLIYSISLILSISLLLTNIISSKRKKKNTINYSLTNVNITSASIQIKKISRIEKYMWYLLISFIDFITNIFANYYWFGPDFIMYSWSFGVIFLSFFSYKILNYKLYKHHYLSMIIISISSIIGFIITFFNVENKFVHFYSFLICLATTILYILEYTIDKYLMFTKYIKPYEILFSEGIIELVLSIITLIITTNIGFLDNYYDFSKQLDKKEVIIIIFLIIFNFAFFSILIIIIDIYSPYYIFLLYIIPVLFIYLYNLIKIGDYYYFIIIYLLGNSLCIFMSLVFTEIIELNCFGLSYMTKKNIELRARLDSSTEKDIIEEEKKETKFGYQGYIVNLDDNKQSGLIERETRFDNDE